jgi:hypothetical protein
MHTYTRTGKEEYNDTSKKKREKTREEEQKIFFCTQRDRSHRGLLLLFFA